jgi:hypothetical protein
VRWHATGTGTRAEIRTLLEQGRSDGRSERHLAAIEQALADLEAGDTSVSLGEEVTLLVDEG